MATENEKFLEDEKNSWNAIHGVAADIAKKNTAAKIYLNIQGNTGAIIVDTANYVPWDEQLVGIGGDIVGGIIFSMIPIIGTPINFALTASGNSVGNVLQELYEKLKKIDYNLPTQSERENLANQINSGDNTGLFYGAYNPNNSFVPVRRYDPLILDLNGDGVKTISQQTSKTFFDLSGDGMSEQTGWVDSNDGLLVYDKNGNGKIDDISELFGNANQSGFSELKQLFDANRKIGVRS